MTYILVYFILIYWNFKKITTKLNTTNLKIHFLSQSVLNIQEISNAWESRSYRLFK